MTIDDVKNMSVERFSLIVETAVLCRIITGKEAVELIKEFWRELNHGNRA